MISVLTVTKRVGWEKVAIQSIARQTTSEGMEWIIVTENELSKRIYDYATVIQAPPKKEGAYSNLNASLNAGLKVCRGRYILFYQDFIKLQTDTVSKLLRFVDENTFVTTLTRNPDGVEEDPRYLGFDTVRPCLPDEWEANVAIAPRAIIRELGGFDEEYDYGWSWDNVNLAERAQMLGCDFLLDETNRPQLLYHVKEPELNPNMPMNGELHAQKMHNIRLGKEPLALHYL